MNVDEGDLFLLFIYAEIVGMSKKVLILVTEYAIVDKRIMKLVRQQL